MKEKHTDSVQNRFTAYLVAAVENTRKKYWKRKYRLQGREFAQEDLLERKYTDFEEQYRAYVGEHTDFIFRDWKRFGELLTLLESDRLVKAINRLKDRDRTLLFERVYGELTFAELGEQFQMEPKQAKLGNKDAQEEIFRMYRPLLIKNAMEQNQFEEDLYQELSATLLNCIQKFRI